MNKFIIFHQSFCNSAGTERVIFNIAEHLSLKQDSDVTLLLCERGTTELVYDIDKLPIKIESLHLPPVPDSRYKLLMYYFLVSSRLRKYVQLLEKSSLYTVICSNAILSGIFYFLSKDNSNIRLIACEHFSYHISGRLSRLLRKSFYRKVAVVVLTERDKELFLREYKPRLCICIPNAIPFHLKPYAGKDKKIMLSIGRYTYQKGFDLYLKALAKVDRNLLKGWAALIVGEDFGDRRLLERIIEEKQLDFVRLLPPTTDVKSYYGNASFYIMSSRFEGLPMVLLEAMGFGLPIISFDCPTGPAEIVDETNGILVPNGDVEALSAAITQFLKNKEILNLKAKGSEEKAHKYSKRNINLIWDTLFDKLWEK